MLTSWFKTRALPIGLDLGVSAIRMVQFAPCDDGYQIHAAGRYDFATSLPEAPEDREKILIQGCKQLMSERGFKGRQVVVGLPDAALQFKNVRMPRMPEDELRQALHWEAVDRFGLSDDQLSVQHITTGEIRQGDEVKNEIILMATTEPQIRSYMNVLSACDLRPESIEPAPVALARCFGRKFRRKADESQVSAIVDVGKRLSRVLILRGRNIVFYKTIDVGGEHLSEAVARQLHVSIEDAAKVRRQYVGMKESDTSEGRGGDSLFGKRSREEIGRSLYDATRKTLDGLASEIGLCLRYYTVTFRGARPNHIDMVGIGAWDPQIVHSIGASLDINIELADPLAGLELNDLSIFDSTSDGFEGWATVVGLALRPSASEVGKRGAA